VLSFSVSFSLVVLTQVIARLFSSLVAEWFVVLGACALLLLFASFKRKKKHPEKSAKVSFSARIKNTKVGSVILIMGSFSVYHVLVGAYTEIPSDFWTHLGHVTDQLILLESGRFDGVEKITQLMDDALYVPLIHALVAWQLGVIPLELVTPATLVTSAIFLLTVYFFSLRIQSEVQISERQKVAVAIVTTTLTVLVFGVASFSYVRYYAYFPHILNMAMMLVAMTIFLDILEGKNRTVGASVLCAIFVLVMGVVNTQEALFTLVLMVTTCIWRAGRSLTQRVAGAGSLSVPALTLGLALIIVLAIVVGLGFNESAAAYLGNPHLFDLGRINSTLTGLLIANPDLRFWDTLGWFGVGVYAWFFFRWQWFKGQDFVCGAMVSPLLTLFNPIFVVGFLQVAGWDPLWRLAFLIPIPFVAASLLVRSTDQVFGANWTVSVVGTRMIFVAVISLIFPLKFGWFHNETSRIPSLSSVDTHNGARLWIDLIRFLDNQENREIFITDNVTNYVLHTATKHQGASHPKMRWQQNENPFSGNYKDRLTYYKRDGELIIVNHRDGELSVNGKVSRHWRSDILKVSTLYPAELLEYLLTNPEEFELIWKKDKIFVFRIKGGGRE